MKDIMAILICSVFTVIGVMLLLTSESAGIGIWAVILFFGACAIALIYINVMSQRRKQYRSPVKKQGLTMGKDALIAFYGIRIELAPDDEKAFDACAAGTDARCQKAKAAGLQTFADRLTEGQDYFLYIGENLGLLGLQHAEYSCVESTQLVDIMARVQTKLTEAGFAQKPSLHLQCIFQY